MVFLQQQIHVHRSVLSKKPRCRTINEVTLYTECRVILAFNQTERHACNILGIVLCYVSVDSRPFCSRPLEQKERISHSGRKLIKLTNEQPVVSQLASFLP